MRTSFASAALAEPNAQCTPATLNGRQRLLIATATSDAKNIIIIKLCCDGQWALGTQMRASNHQWNQFREMVSPLGVLLNGDQFIFLCSPNRGSVVRLIDIVRCTCIKCLIGLTLLKQRHKCNEIGSTLINKCIRVSTLCSCSRRRCCAVGGSRKAEQKKTRHSNFIQFF